jgi:3-oxoacyl-[acyl-carrier protein] reductase
MPKPTAIVTGASQGIGRATALRLARDFGSLVLVARNREKLEEVANDARAAGAEALVIDADLSRPEAAQPVVDATLKAFGRVDALLNIAGAVPQIDLFEMSDAQWEAGLALKLRGARRLTMAAWPALKGHQGGRGPDVGELGAVPQGALCGCRHDQRGHRCSGQGLLGPWHRRRWSTACCRAP